MVHPYEVRQYRAEERLPERHVLHERTEHKRTAARRTLPRGRAPRSPLALTCFQGRTCDALKQATERAKKGKEGVWSADTYVCAPLHSDTIRISV